ncbi:MAG: Fe-S protein assembly co-chaperone HscB [Ferruginibacter sp.]|nr:Fe-S protein assembly co-chaperone HscB [Chitinophagaceae bacterium]
MAMTYFELFEIPVHLKVNAVALSKKFFELSRKYHPDYFATGNEEIQAEALERSALLNKAWKTFQNPDEIIKYVLQSKGLLEEGEKYALPPAFLMEVLEINEQLMEMDGKESGVGSRESGVKGIQTTIDLLQSEIYEPVKQIVENYEDGITTEKELLQVKEYYYKKKYIDRIRKELTVK